jgi:hypothetical protein
MTIETKYNIGQEVWMIRDNEVQNHEIRSITINKTPTTFIIYYSFADMFNLEDYKTSEFSTDMGLEWWREEKLFPTKEELLKSL